VGLDLFPGDAQLLAAALISVGFFSQPSLRSALSSSRRLLQSLLPMRAAFPLHRALPSAQAPMARILPRPRRPCSSPRARLLPASRLPRAPWPPRPTHASPCVRAVHPSPALLSSRAPCSLLLPPSRASSAPSLLHFPQRVAGPPCHSSVTHLGTSLLHARRTPPISLPQALCAQSGPVLTFRGPQAEIYTEVLYKSLNLLFFQLLNNI
jgi:hypothetical protein